MEEARHHDACHKVPKYYRLSLPLTPLSGTLFGPFIMRTTALSSITSLSISSPVMARNSDSQVWAWAQSVQLTTSNGVSPRQIVDLDVAGQLSNHADSDSTRI
jgi:hypothetical protein